MSQYKVLSSFTFRGAKRKAGDVIELTETKLEKLKALGFGDKVEAVGNGAKTSMSDEINGAPESNNPAETPETPATPSNEAGEGTQTPETPAVPSTEGSPEAPGASVDAPAGEKEAE